MLCCGELPASVPAGHSTAGISQSRPDRVEDVSQQRCGDCDIARNTCSGAFADHNHSSTTQTGWVAATSASAQAVLSHPATTHSYSLRTAVSSIMQAGSSSSSPTMQPGPTLTNLPFEALACIAALLEQPDRRAFALTCTAAAHSVSSTTSSLVVPMPGPAGVSQQRQQDGTKARLLQRYIGVQNLRITSCQLCHAQQQQQQLQQQQLQQQQISCSCCTAPSSSSSAFQPLPPHNAAAAAAAMHWWPAGQPHHHHQQQQQTSADLAYPASVAAAGMQRPAAGQIAHQQQQQHVPLAARAAARSNCCDDVAALGHTLESTTSSSSLIDMIAAAGSSMPYLTSLNLSGVCLHSLRATPGGCAAALTAPAAAAAAAGSIQTSFQAGSSNSLLETICTACPNLAVLSLPDHLWQDLASPRDPQNPASYCPVITQGLATPGAAMNPVGLVIQSDRVQMAQVQSLGPGHNAALGLERLASLTGLKNLRVLKLGSGAVPAGVLSDLGLLIQLHSLSVCASGDLLLPAGSSSGSSGGTILGTALSNLRFLCKLSISGITESGCGCLDQLSSLTNLTHLDLKESTDLKVSSLGSISGLTALRVLRIRRLRCLQAKSRASLPLGWQNMKQLAVMLLDFDLHLRDVQVLAGMPQLALLGAASLHICVNPRFGLSLPNIRHLALHTLPLLPLAAVPAAAVLQQAVQDLQQQQQQVIQQQLLQQLMQLQQGVAGAPLQQQQQFVLVQQQPPAAAAANGQQQQQQWLYFLPAQAVAGAMAFPAAAAAGGGGGPTYVLVNTHQQVQQQQQQFHQLPNGLPGAMPPITAAAAAAAAPVVVHDKGWLSQLCPNLDELLVGIVDSNAFQAMRGHKTLKRIVFGVGSAASAACSSSSSRSLAAAAADPAAAAAALGWSVLPTLPSLESIKVINTDDVLSTIGLALPYLRNCSSISFQRASCIGTLESWMISCYCRNLQLLAVEDSLVLSDAALRHLAALPKLKHIFLTGCPSISPQGLQHLLLYCQALESVSLYSCTGIHADVAEVVQQAVQRVTGRKVAVHWRSGRGGG